MPSGQPVYQSATPVSGASTGPSWGAIAAIATTTAPQLGQALGNAQLSQVGTAVGQAAMVYGQTQAIQQRQPQYGQPQYSAQGPVASFPALPGVPKDLTQLLTFPAGTPQVTASLEQMVRNQAMLNQTNAQLDSLLGNTPNTNTTSGLSAAEDARATAYLQSVLADEASASGNTTTPMPYSAVKTYTVKPAQVVQSNTTGTAMPVGSLLTPLENYNQIVANVAKADAARNTAVVARNTEVGALAVAASAAQVQQTTAGVTQMMTTMEPVWAAGPAVTSTSAGCVPLKPGAGCSAGR